MDATPTATAPYEPETAESIPSHTAAALPLPVGTLATFILKILAVLTVGWFSYLAVTGSFDAADRVSHSMAVRDSLANVLSALKDAETGQRGFLLVGEDRYLDPYIAGSQAYRSSLATLKLLVERDPAQRHKVVTIEQLGTDKLQELDRTISMARSGDTAAALAEVRTGLGRRRMDGIRSAVAEMADYERAALAKWQGDWQDAMRTTGWVVGGGLTFLLALILASIAISTRDFRQRREATWLRGSQAALASRMHGDLRLEALGDRMLRFLAQRLQAPVGALFVRPSRGPGLRRVAAHALSEAQVADASISAGHGLVGEILRDGRMRHVRELPPGYLPVASATGRADAAEVVLVPATAFHQVEGVLELGFLRKLRPIELELLSQSAQIIGLSIRAAKDRQQLEDLLAQTQSQAEELQAQQEELRVNNEELEEKSRILAASQAELESQQAELEQTNAVLQEHATMLRDQRDHLRLAQAQMAEKARELERANRYKSEFLANMSHELRTPLNSTLMLAKLLADNRDGNLSEQQVKYARTISSAGHDLLTLINDILDLAKIEAGKVELDPRPVALRGLVEEIARIMRPVADHRRLAFDVKVRDDAPLEMTTDAERLGQVLKNLLSNAIKFTERGGVTLEVGGAPEGVAFKVVDTGIGIPPEQQQIIFEAFRQADGSTHRRYGGSGLGLSISRDLAQLLGGRIAVNSAEGQGSVFTLTLPLVLVSDRDSAATDEAREMSVRTHAAPEASAGPPSAALDAWQASASPAAMATALDRDWIDDDRAALTDDDHPILVIEDDAAFAEILRDLIREMGWRCVAASSAAAGMAAVARYQPRAILLDMKLPDGSGLSVLDRLKHDPQSRHIPVHVISVADYARVAMERGAIGYALKPVDRDKLMFALRRLETKASQRLRRILVVEDDPAQREAIRGLLALRDVELSEAATSSEAIELLKRTTFDCVVMDLQLPDLSGMQLLETMATWDAVSFPPVIVYTGRSISPKEEQELRRFSKSIIIKDARSPERLLDEVTLFLHQVEADLPAERQRMLAAIRDRDEKLEGRRVLLVEDDVRNVFALVSVLEPKGIKISIARNGLEAIAALEKEGPGSGSAAPIELVLMDIMMPEMDGLTAMREIRKRPLWQRLPIIALTAKAMKDDQEQCIDAGANDYAAKPLDVDKLLSLVRVWMPR